MKGNFDFCIQLFADGGGAAVGTEQAAENGAASACASDADIAANTDSTVNSDSGKPTNGEPAAAAAETHTEEDITREASETHSENGEEETSAPDGESDANGAENVLNAAGDSLAQALAAAQTDEIIASWRREENETREIYSSFSMKNEILNEPLFGTLLKSGVGVRQAYECVHLREIIGSAVRYAVVETGRKAAGAVRTVPQRPNENSVLGRAASVTRTDVNSLTDRDIMRILSEVSRGAKISFK